MNVINCPNCSAKVPAGAAFCDNCGTPLSGVPSRPAAPAYGSPAAPGFGGSAGSSLCPNCGEPVLPGEAFCGNCGQALGGVAPGGVAPGGVAPGGGAPAGGSPSYAPPPANPSPPIWETSPSWPPAAVPPPTAVNPPPASWEKSAPSWPPPPAAPDMPTWDSAPSWPAAPQPQTAGNGCPNCGVPIQPSDTFCDNCGQALTPKPAGYQQATQQPAPPPSVPDPSPQPPWPPEPAMSVVNPRLVVQTSGATLNLPPGKNEYLIGREDPVSGSYPDVDLVPYGGEEGGVSRRHAQILRRGTTFLIEDLNSVNYTFVNRQKVAPGSPHPLKEGDEIRLGRVVLQFKLN